MGYVGRDEVSYARIHYLSFGFVGASRMWRMPIVSFSGLRLWTRLNRVVQNILKWVELVHLE